MISSFSIIKQKDIDKKELNNTPGFLVGLNEMETSSIRTISLHTTFRETTRQVIL